MNDELYFEEDWGDIRLNVRKKPTKNVSQITLYMNQMPPEQSAGIFK
jgi:hypothetical protein